MVADPRNIITFAGLATCIAISGCHPLSWWTPPRLPTHEPHAYTSSAQWPREAPVDVRYDERGVPHIRGEELGDLAYAIGFVHARDRLFQIDVVRGAAHGRLAEIFGEALLPIDRKLRLINFGLEARMDALDPDDRMIVEAYAAGLNDGAVHAGGSADMAILGREWTPFTARDAIAIGTLQAWRLSRGMSDELARLHVVAALSPDDPRRAPLMAPIWSGDAPIVGSSGAKAATSTTQAYLQTVEAPEPPGAVAEAVVRWLGLNHVAGSNSWAVSGAKTASGRPILCNDPHLTHRAPGVFYMVAIDHPKYAVTGVTFPGIPAVLIGHGRHVAWGMTSSFADVQDLVQIAPDPDSEDHYRVDGQRLKYEVSPQRFYVKGRDDPAVTEQWRATIFGPVLPEAHVEGLVLKRPLALQWSGFSGSPALARSVSGFWALAAAKDLSEAEAAVESISMSAQNVVLAFTDGTIAYRLAALTPVRSSSTAGLLPLDGASKDARWRGFTRLADRPSVTNPARGFIVTANQRITDAPAGVNVVGWLGAPPNRARRITERMGALLAEGPATVDALLDVQQDAVSIEAREVAPILGASCPTSVAGHRPDTVKAYCRALRDFDGHYTVDTLAGLPYTLTIRALRSAVLRRHLGPRAEGAGRGLFIRTLLQQAIVAEGRGQPHPLFDDPATPEREGLQPYLAEAARAALDELVETAGDDPEDWRWGDHHRLVAAGPLARAPVIGGLFEIDAGPQAGHGDAPRAEGGVPVKTGAAFRMAVELSSPPQARMTIDTGNSGHPSSPHFDDQVEAWTQGRPTEVTPPGADNSQGRLRLLPAAAATR